MLDLEVVGQGMTTKIYRDGNKAIKLYENSPGAAEYEYERHSFAVSVGLPVPAVFGVRQLAGSAAALEMEYVHGKPMIYPGMDKKQRDEAICKLAELQCMVHGFIATGQPKQIDVLARKIKQTWHISDMEKGRVLELLHQLDKGGDRLCHGDFHVLNVIFDGEKHWLIDWVDATSGSPLADACRTYVIFKQYFMRQAGNYLRAFCKIAKVKKEDVLVWLPVVAAARLAENMEDEQRKVLLEMVTNYG